ncbi:hypothetical protein CCP3SC15_6260001 [Gammaproteobacteria bacterium]
MYKYALRQTFCIETGDDPDKSPSQQQERAQPHADKPAQEPAAVDGSFDPTKDSKGKPFTEMAPGELAGHMTKYAAEVKAGDKHAAAKLAECKKVMASREAK